MPELALCAFGTRRASSESESELELELLSSITSLTGLLAVLPGLGTIIGVAGLLGFAACPPLSMLKPNMEKLERRGMNDLRGFSVVGWDAA